MKTLKNHSILFLCMVFGAGALRGASRPLLLPPNFDPEAFMVSQTVEGRKFHSLTGSVQLARELVANGALADLETAEKVLDAVLSCQERKRDDPHYGNFRWTKEEPVVEDLNAVEFALLSLTPILSEHKDRLSQSMQARLLESIRLGLEEIRRIDVHVAYTNIALMDITNSCLGGELLNDARMAEQGYQKFLDWMSFTDRSGATYEYNSANYTTVAIRVLSQLARLVRDGETRTRARVMLARVGLSAALHMHPATGRWAGPHGRAYHGTVAGDGPRGGLEIETFRGFIRDGVLPQWLADAAEWREQPIQVVETTDAANGIGTSTYHGKSFSLGVATRELNNQANRYIAWQSNLFTVHYRRGEGLPPGSVFSRYIVDDEWLGDFQSTPARAKGNVIPETGLFHGVQDRQRAVCLYTTAELGGLRSHFSAKAIVAWPRWEAKDELWVGDKRVERLPAVVPPGSTVVVVSGDAMTAIRPVALTDLGRNAPIRLAELSDRTLVLEMYNYLGPRKTFWELATPGTFYQGAPRCGFYAEVAERSEYPNGAAFARVVSSGKLTDQAEQPFTYDGQRSRLWKVEYARDGRSLGVETDLMNWAKPARRWTDKGELGQPMLESPFARESRTGKIQVGDATLTCGKQPAWLFVSPRRRLLVAAYHGLDPAPLTLKLPEGSVEIEGIGTGTVIWDNGNVAVEGLHLKGTPRVMGGRLVSR